jgi:aromatic ring-opening dioxygenase catalytic subunit (LigB family)
LAELVGIYAASHGPMIVRNWDKLTPAEQGSIDGGFFEIGRRIAQARPDVLVVISPDHWVNFFIDNLPSICVGVGEIHDGPPEPWFKAFPHKTLPGHPALAQHIVRTALERDFEPSVSYKLALDHGFCIPLWKAKVDPLPAIVPVIFNDIEPPFPSVRRCYAWGAMLAEAIAGFPGKLRVGVLATGGLSHSIGEADMGRIDEAFDRDYLRRLEAGDPRALIDFLNERLPGAGNGASEVRNWVAAHGAAKGRGFELIHYDPIPKIYVGAGFASWKLT